MLESCILRIIMPVGTHHIATRFDQVFLLVGGSHQIMARFDEVGGVYVDVKLYAEYRTPTITLEPPL